jgi:hypothetical protein
VPFITLYPFLLDLLLTLFLGEYQLHEHSLIFSALFSEPWHRIDNMVDIQ